MIKRAQNRIAQSRWSLPVTAVYGLLVFLLSGNAEKGLWVQLLAVSVSTMMMVILNNSNSLIRIYSRMVSCSFCVAMVMTPFLFSSVSIGVAQLSFIVFLFFLFHAYQDKRAVGWVFYAYASLGVGSLACVEMLCLVPLLWVLQATNVLAHSFRTYCASVLGLLVPYWFVGGYCLYMGMPEQFVHHFLPLTTWQPLFNYSLMDIHRWLTLAFVGMLGVIGTIHFLAFSYQDKIRTRMIYEMFIALEVGFLALIFVQPEQFDLLLSLLLVPVSPLIGHFLSLTHSRITNIMFFALVAVALSLTFYNIWMP